MATFGTIPSQYIDPSNGVQATTGNYKNTYDYTDQYLPDAKGEMIRIFYGQSLLGFLEAFAHEEGLSSDQFIWAEEGRRHKLHTGVTRVANVFTLAGHTIREHDWIMVSDVAGGGVEFGLVTAKDATTFTAVFDGGAAWTIGTTALTVRSFGSMFGKGTAGKAEALTREFSTFRGKPVIMKDQFEVAGSDMPNISWIYSPDGTSPYWYMEDEEEAFKRFLDNCETQLILQNSVDAGSGLASDYDGTEGLFPAIRSRGNTVAGKLASITDFENLAKRLDKVNGEQYNGLFISTDHSLTIDRTLAELNQYDPAAANYGLFENNKDLIMDLGFKGFRIAEYEFYKQGWKFLKDPTAYNPDNFNAADQVHGIMVPLGTTNLKNTIEGNAQAKVPYLTQMYKEKPGYSRKMETHYHGSAMVPDATDTLDVFGVDWRTERGLRPAGMIKWAIFEGA
jgi:hypothetical protein